MSEQPPQTWLERLLAAEAEQAISESLDLWPGISHRLRERGASGRPRFNANGAVEARDLGTVRTERRSLPFAAHAKLRSGELIGAAISFGLAALVVAIFAVIASRPDADSEQLGFGNSASEQVIPAASTPALGGDPAMTETKPVLVTGPDCTFDLDVSLESDMESVQVTVRARSNWGCANTGTLRLTIVDSSGERAAIAGNPLILPLAVEGRERHVDSTVIWSNWCGERGRFRLETSFGDEQRMHEILEAPRCVDQTRPPTLRMIDPDAASATPEKQARQGTPIP